MKAFIAFKFYIHAPFICSFQVTKIMGFTVSARKPTFFLDGGAGGAIHEDLILSTFSACKPE